MTQRHDETWHRLLEWTNGQAQSERLAAQIVLDAGYTDLEPSHPLGGKDGAKDAVCFKGGRKYVMAVYFPRGHKKIRDIKNKFMSDLAGVSTNKASGMVFVTNQELRDAERDKLRQAAGPTEVVLFHLETLVAVLDQPRMAGVRHQFLAIDHCNQQLNAGWVKVLPADLTPLIGLELTTPPSTTRNIAQSADGQFWLVYWDTQKCLYKCEKVNEEYAADALRPVAIFWGMTDWRKLLEKRAK